MSLLDLLIPAAHAQAAAGVPAQPSPWSGVIMLGAVFVLMYFMMIRPQMKRQKEARQMTESLAKGDEIITVGGLAGRVISLGEVYLTVDLADNVLVKVEKSAVAKVLPKGTLKQL